MLVAYAAAKRGPPVGRIRTAAEALPAPSQQPNSQQPNSPSHPGEIRRRSRWPPVGAHPVKPKRCAGGLPRMRWPCGNARLPSNHSVAPRCASHQTRRSAAPKRGTSLRKLRRRSRVSRLAHALAQRRRETPCLLSRPPFRRRPLPKRRGLSATLTDFAKRADSRRAGAGHHSHGTAKPCPATGAPGHRPSSPAIPRDSCPYLRPPRAAPCGPPPSRL